MPEAHFLASQPQLFKFVGRVEPVDGDVFRGGTQILPDGKKVTANLPQIGHGSQQFVSGFAHPDNYARLGHHDGIEPLDERPAFLRLNTP